MPQNISSLIQGLSEALPTIFEQAQVSIASHRKHCVALYRMHIKASDTSDSTSRTMENGEAVFFDMFTSMIARILVVKKGPIGADRLVRFICAYAIFLTEKTWPKQVLERTLTSEDEDQENTPATRFVFHLISWLLRGLSAKDKNVRFRCVSIVTGIIGCLGELDEDLFTALRRALIERTQDKEPVIRAQAIFGLAKLLGGEDANELAGDEPSILEVLLDGLCYDSDVDVRRAALVHLPFTARTLPALLTRTRDVDPVIRGLMFCNFLNPVFTKKLKVNSGTVLVARLRHPRQLTLSQREQVVQDGQGDKEDAIRVATGRMLAGWFDVIRAETNEGVLVAASALSALFYARPELLRSLNFDDDYWGAMTPESALLVRVFVDHCLQCGQQACIDQSGLPVVTMFAFYLQESCNTLFDRIEALEETRLLTESRSVDEDDGEERLDKMEDSVVAWNTIVGEILLIVALCDFADEIGRRKVFAVIREMLTHEMLLENLVESCLEILFKTTASERELIRIVVEIITELRDDGDGDIAASQGNGSMSGDTTQSSIRSKSLRRAKAHHEMTPEERARADTVDTRCLGLCIAMLTRIEGSFDRNSTLEGILADLIIPSVKRTEPMLRERGLVCLGLCCLMDKNMAMNSFQLFLNQAQSAPEALKVKALHIIFDLLMVYDEELLFRSEQLSATIIAFLLRMLEMEDDSEAVQSVLCIGISKLMLNDLISDERVLMGLVLAYVSPMTRSNEELRQCLNYTLPAYCYSSAANQKRMQSITVLLFDLVLQIYGEAEEGEMIAPSQFGQLLVDWTNPHNVVKSGTSDDHAEDVQVDIAIDILKASHDPNRSSEDRNTICQMLQQLYFPDHADTVALWTLVALSKSLQDRETDAATVKILERFQKQISKRYSRQLKNVNEQDIADDERVRELEEFFKLIREDAANVESPAKVKLQDENDTSHKSPGLHVLGSLEVIEVDSTANHSMITVYDRKASSSVSSHFKTHKLHRNTVSNKENEGMPVTPHRARPPKRFMSPMALRSLPSPKRSHRRSSPEKEGSFARPVLGNTFAAD